jgi:hypothetical protein
MLQAGRSPVRAPDEVGSTQPLTKMSTRNFSGGNKRPARRADNIAAICVPNV